MPAFRDAQSIDGCKLIPLEAHGDRRGWLAELFRTDELEKEFIPAMGYVSMTLPGRARGPHEHKGQTDYFCFVGPADLLLVLWDRREGSKTNGCRMVKTAGDKNKFAVVVPPGVVHAYANIGGKDAYVINFPNRLYGGKSKKEKIDEIRHEEEGNIFFEDFKRITKERSA